jgi:hypothetical protein
MAEISIKNVSEASCHPAFRNQPRSLIDLKARQIAKIAELRHTLLAAGYHSLDSQAAVLGLSRSTTWIILKANHKASGLTASVISRILCSHELPPNARRVIEEYVAEKLTGAYGHSRHQLRKFRARLGLGDKAYNYNDLGPAQS